MNTIEVTYERLIADSQLLAAKIPGDKYSEVFGVPSGGILPAYIVAQKLKLPLISKEQISKDTLIVDDLIDSGQTLRDIGIEHDSAVLYKKPNSPATTYFLKEIPEEWINLPHESKGNEEVTKNVTRLLEYLGENPNREGLIDTPRRVIKSYAQLFSGYEQDIDKILTVFSGEQYDQMVLLKDIEFYSTCEHHMLPFFGKAHVAYIPNEKIIGLSKLARVVDIFAKRLQNQERLTMQVAETLQNKLSPKGVAVVMEGEHFCMKARGVNKQHSLMKTAHVTGIFRTQPETRQEFYDMIR